MIEVKTNRFPTLYYKTVESAREDADKVGVSICKIIYVDEWNGKVEESFMRYGLYDGKLLGTKDFEWVHL